VPASVFYLIGGIVALLAAVAIRWVARRSARHDAPTAAPWALALFVVVNLLVDFGWGALGLLTLLGVLEGSAPRALPVVVGGVGSVIIDVMAAAGVLRWRTGSAVRSIIFGGFALLLGAIPMLSVVAAWAGPVVAQITVGLVAGLIGLLVVLVLRV
jgi:hypothetical protein